MSSDSPSPRTDEPVWGTPQPGRKWTGRHTLAAVGIAAVIAAFGGAAIYAATSGHSNALGLGSPGPDGRRLSTTGPAGALHGEFIVAQNGGYTTELVQRGVLTAVSDTSITAKSEDGFIQTYTLAPHSRTNTVLAVDDTVTIRATKTDEAATATMVESDDAGPR